MNRVIVGKIVNTCGLKGEVKIINSSDFIEERYKKNNELMVINEDKKIDKVLTISSFRVGDKFIYVKFKEINSIEEAELLKESYICVDGNSLKKVNDDTFYYYELLEMQAYYNGKKIGIISEISNNGVQDLLRINGIDFNILVPFVDAFIEKIDQENKVIYFKNLEGLL